MAFHPNERYNKPYKKNIIVMAITEIDSCNPQFIRLNKSSIFMGFIYKKGSYYRLYARNRFDIGDGAFESFKILNLVCRGK